MVIKIYLILPASLWNSTTVITIVPILCPCSFHKLKSLWLDLASGVEFLVRKNSTLPQKNDQSYQAKRLIIIQNSSFSFVCSYQCIILSTLSNASNFKIIDWFLVKPPSEIFFKVDKLQLWKRNFSSKIFLKLVKKVFYEGKFLNIHCRKYLAKLIWGHQIAIFLARGWQKNYAKLTILLE